MNMKSMALPLVLSLLLSGCASVKFPLVEDMGPTAAKVRFISDMDKAWIDLYPPNECNNGVNVVFDNFVSNLIKATSEGAPRRVGMIDPQDPSSRSVSEYSLKGGQIINVGVGGNLGRCLYGRSFLAEAGMQYEVALRGSVSNGCVIRINQLVLREGEPRREAVFGAGPMICKSAY